jgi:hypothetical protein
MNRPGGDLVLTTCRQNRFRHILLPANPPDPSRPAPVEISGRTVFLRLRLRRGITAHDVRGTLAALARANPALASELAATAAWLYTDATH